MSITLKETIKILTAKAECMRRETSGIDIDCNYRNCDECDLCYKQGTTGDQIEALGVAISALQAQNLQPTCNQLATDTISRQAAIDALHMHLMYRMGTDSNKKRLDEWINNLPSVQPERKKMSNKEWVDFLSEQFTVSRTSAREMLHGLMRWKAEDNFKKQFSGGRNESRRR